jgi:tetratricopeptide (TPR) repeat protein
LAYQATFPGASTPEEWAKTGRVLFGKALYQQAIFCFERANLTLERDISAAYLLRQEARIAFPRGRTTDPTKSNDAYRKVGEAFAACARAATGKQQRRCYRLAGDTFVLATADKLAGQAYLSAEEYTLSAKHLRRAEDFDGSIAVIQEHRMEMDEAVAEEIWGTAKVYYLQKNKIE